MSNPVFQEIEKIIQSKPVALFMKGSPQFPMCGFSARVVDLLAESGIDPDQLVTFDVLSDENIRQGIKEFANWPTIPQLYVKGEFVGGCDIVSEMFEKGELKTVLEQAQS